MHDCLPKECIQCGECIKDCIIVRYGGYSLVSILNRDSEKGAWNCSNCWKCIEACPVGIDIVKFLEKRRKIEKPPQAIAKGIEMVMKKGYFMDLVISNDFRENVGLKPLKFFKEAEIELLLGEK